ncbi:histidyl-tRNA synthetase [Candidatus Phycorickettsia trachydisci]|uniref:Histidine--tRNA ligase n=1 Tax=Candidatus Phycorickettsia trachydisci TaxID=2115978 RepID=A0A2P1P6V5_9RICK|nr:histidine--tRNA ligase [Candidatus Phycorickettsia trachydisci]AVP87000.1 histidyl-tRNA synthetase [Candidatus Phycorickettsia trachydisci]
MTNLRSIKGCKDVLFDDALRLSHIVETAKRQAILRGCTEIFTPIMEHTEVFSRGLGDFSDIVHKEMYSFIDKGKHSLTLRPEFTAGIMRAVFTNSLQHKLPLKLFSWGPVFRRENPQAGRQRQFHQINVEFIGFKDYTSDVEIISLANEILQNLGIANYRLEINSLGCNESRKNYQKALLDYFNDHKNQLSEISKIRLDTNPLRILDSKEECDISLVKNAPNLQDYYTNQAKEYFEQVLAALKALKIDHVVNSRIVRGLDYYSHTVFEFISSDLGAQSTLMAGGRYDGLAELMGGSSTPAIGFAGGIERLMMVCNQKISKTKPVIILPITDKEKHFALKTADTLRQNHIACSIETGGKMKDIMQKAVNKYEPKYAIIIGEDEAAKNMYTLKNLDEFSQGLVNLDQMLEVLKNETE